MTFRVLMIDDEETFCEVVKRGLEKMGIFEVGFATDGKTGLLMARKGAPDVILLDVCMPKMSGIEVLRALKKDYPLSEIPVIMLSGLVDEATKKECNYQYGEEYVEKPVDLAQLRSRIEAVLRRVGKLHPLPAAAIS
ncbi:MAG: response regulator transcription factor [Kiritimatiellia bacterium]